MCVGAGVGGLGCRLFENLFSLFFRFSYKTASLNEILNQLLEMNIRKHEIDNFIEWSILFPE